MPSTSGGSSGDQENGGAGGPPGGPGTQGRDLPGQPAPDGPPLLSEELDWRARALKAEEEVAQLQSELAQIKDTLAQARERLDTTQQQSLVQRELTAAGALDLESTTLLINRALESMPTPDVLAAVADLKQRKPMLFKQSPPPGPRISAMSGAVDAPDPLGALASQARDSGDRRLLMRYLRARRRH